MEENKTLRKLIQLFWMFVLGCFVGYIFETGCLLLRGTYEVRKGLIYGPLIPVYGIGAVVYHLLLSNLKLDKLSKWKQILLVFFITMFLGGVTEYICSFFQEKCLGAVSWDYSYLKINFNGRTSLLHCTYWGLLGIFYYCAVLPLVLKTNELCSKTAVKVVTILAAIFMIFDIVISTVAMYRHYQRRQNIAPRNFIERFLDEKYPDEFLKTIYVNLRER